MSTSPYSLDLREKVIKYIESGGSQISASNIFNLGYSTVHKWYKRYKTEGHFKPRSRLGAKPKIDRDEFIKYVKTHDNADAMEIGVYFGISPSGARYWLKKIGFSYKKKPLPTWRLAKKNSKNS